MKKEILLGLTTTRASDWRQKIADIDTLGIKKVALFLTGLGLVERQELYRLLEATQLEEMPHVHIRDDVELQELDYLIERYHTVAFNIHPEAHYKWRYDYANYPGMIFIENLSNNSGGLPLESELKRYPGLCLDYAHWENHRRCNAGQDDDFVASLLLYIQRYPIGCCHVSSIREEPSTDQKDIEHGTIYDAHSFRDLNELDYMQKYISYLPPRYISLELENSFQEQLEAKAYLEKLLALE